MREKGYAIKNELVVSEGYNIPNFRFHLGLLMILKVGNMKSTKLMIRSPAT